MSAPENAPAKSRGKTLLIGFIKLVLAAIVIYFAGRQFVGHWDEVTQYQWTLNPLYILLSIALHLIAFVIFAKTWCILMRSFGYDVSLPQGFKVSYLANLGRYIPGKIWPVFGMVYMLKQIKVSKESAITGWVVATLLGWPPAFLVGSVALYFYPEMLNDTLGASVGAGPLIAVLTVLAGALVLALFPGKSVAPLNWVLIFLKRPPITFKLNIKLIFTIYLSYTIAWSCYGLAFYTLMHGIMVDPAIPAIAGIGSWVLAYILGYLAFFAPGGLGVRELIIISVLAAFLGKPVATGVAAAARIWNLVSEFLAAAISLPIRLNKKED